MPHMASGEDGQDSYADMEFHQQRYLLTADGPIGQSIDDIRDLDTGNAPPNDLDSNELAELVYAQIVPFVNILDTGNDEQPGTVEARTAMGINLSQDDLPVLTPDNDVENNTVVTSTTVSGAASIGGVVDDPGVLDARYMWPGFSGYNNSTTGAGGAGGSGQAETVTINFREVFGHGPFLDQADDITVAAYIDKRNTVDAAQTGYVFQLAYDVHTVEDARASFAPARL